MNISEIIFEEIRLITQEMGTPEKRDLDLHTEVFASGLDSLGFAILVAKLEERLGYDPFIVMAKPIYPKTIGEFIGIYELHGKSL